MIITSRLLPWLLALLAIVSGYFTYLGYAPYFQDFALYQGLVVYAFTYTVRPLYRKWKYLLPFLWDWSFSFSTLYWLNETVGFYGNIPAWMSLTLVLVVTALIACRSILVALVWNLLNPRFYLRFFILLPVVYSLVTYLFYEKIIQFGWLNFGYAKIDQLAKIFAPLGGVYLVQFIKFSLATSVVALLYYLFVRSSKAATLSKLEESASKKTIYRNSSLENLKQIPLGMEVSSDALASGSVIAHGTKVRSTVATFKERRLTDFLAFCLVVGIGVYSLVISPPSYTVKSSEPIAVALVQPNFDPRGKWDRATIQSQIRQFANDLHQGAKVVNPPSLYIFPESAIGADYSLLRAVFKYYGNLAGHNNAEVLLGSMKQPYVDAFLFTSQDLLQRKAQGLLASKNTQANSEEEPSSNEPYPQEQVQHKRHLVPFGEYLPAAGLLRRLHSFFETLDSYQLQKGPIIQAPLESLHSNLAVMICYDSLFGTNIAKDIFVNSQAGKEPNVLVSISNDVWFGDTEGPAQHFNIIRFRAIENQRYLLRSANNGITAIVNPEGVVTKIIPRNQYNVLYGTYENYEGLTPYQENININSYLLLSLLAFICFIRVLALLVFRSR